MRGGTIVYALGGGAGHLARAMALAPRLHARLVLHAASFVPAPPPPGVRLARVPGDLSIDVFRRALAAILADAERLVVDTFPRGIAHELDDALFARVPRKTLIRRYVRPGSYEAYDEAAARFDELLVPHAEGASEWEQTLPKDRLIGTTSRKLEIEEGPEAPLVVVGDDEGLLPGLRAMIPPGTVFVRGPFTSLPRARAYLSTGAGYNITYELAALGVNHGLVPRPRRWDDQYRRAELCGRAVLGRADLARLLAAPRRGDV